MEPRGTPAHCPAMTEESIGTEALKPHPALAAFAPFIGTWATEGTHPDVPGKTFHGRTSFAWHQGGAFVVMHTQVDEPEVPSGVAIFGSDDGANRHHMLYFDERGISRHYAVTLAGNVVALRRDDPAFAQTTTYELSEDGKTIRATGRFNKAGAGWRQDLTMTFTRLSD